MVAWLVCRARITWPWRLAQFAELPGHGVEGRRQLPQFVLRSDGHHLVQVAGPDGRRRFGDRADRVENGGDRAGHQQHRQAHAQHSPRPYHNSVERAARRASASACSMASWLI